MHDVDIGSTNGFAVGVHHKPLYSLVHFLDVCQESLSVGLPDPFQLVGIWVFGAPLLNGYFEAVGVEVVVVLHASLDTVPGSTISDPFGKPIIVSRACSTQVHSGVGIRVRESQPAEDIVIRASSIN